MESKKSYQKLIVHQKADKLALSIYEKTKSFPKDEIFGLISQMRRAALSIPANIAEGYLRRGAKDKIRFFNIAQGSLVELEYYIDFSERLNYLDKKSFEELCDIKNEVGKLLFGYTRALINSVPRYRNQGTGA